MASYVSAESREACDDPHFALAYVRGALETALATLNGNSTINTLTEDIESALDILVAMKGHLNG